MGEQRIKLSEDMIRTIIFEILSIERKNLRSKSKTDQRMSEELQTILIQYSKMVN